EALELPYAARWHSPGAAEISRGINLLKERLIRGYVEDLGNLDAVPSIGSGLDLTSLELEDEERPLLHLIDGISSFADIVHQSRLGRFETYRALSQMVSAGVVEVSPPRTPGTVAAAQRPATSSPPASAGPP